MLSGLALFAIVPPLVPWPRRLRVDEGVTTLSTSARIACRQPALEPLAKILAAEAATGFGAKWGFGEKGQITLAIDPKLRPEQYRLQVNDQITIAGGTYAAVAMGTVTLLQALDGRLRAPRMQVDDEPAFGYRGAMIDVARKPHSIAVLKQCVEMCRLYKIRYLQLHLTDDQAFTFPSQAFPELGSGYTHRELRDLVRYADERGVTLIPELDVPGHSAALVRTLPELFKIAGTKPYEHHATINFANEKAIAAVDTLIGEMCEVFQSSPYFHMGGDEADIANAHQHPDFQAAFAKHGLVGKAQHEIFRLFIRRVNEMVKRRGKRLIVWEGFGRDPASKFPIPKDVLVMAFESAYYLPTDLLADGYQVVNASWTPLYVVNRHVWPARKVYEWNATRFGRHSTTYPAVTWFQAPSEQGIVGAQACAWEQPEHLAVANFRRMLPAMAERVWNPSAGRSYGDFETRWRRTDGLLDRLIHPVELRHGPLIPRGSNAFDNPTFTEPLTIELRSRRPGTIHYTLDGTPPLVESPVWRAPITLSETTTIRATLVENGRRSEFETAATFYRERPKTPNLATGKRVTVSGGTQGPQAPELAVDDDLSLSSSWWASPAPQWLQVDLGSVHLVDRIEVFPYWDGSRYYAYTVEVSRDGESWDRVADRSGNTLPANQNGDSIRFPAQEVRFVRVTMLKNSANEGVHLVELKVWPKGRR